MNNLFEKIVFKKVFILEVPKNIRIINFCFVNKIKNTEIANTFKKSRLVIQVCNDYDKILIFTKFITF